MSNVSRLEFWVDVVNAGVAISLAASFVFGVASILLSRKLGQVKDAESAREKTLSDERIAAANAEAAKASEGVGESREKIAGLNKEAEALKAEAEKAKAERAEADKQIAIAKADAARAKEGTVTAEVEVARLQTVVANAEQKRAEAELALAEIRRKQAPRELPVEKFAEVLRERLPEEVRLPVQVLYQRDDAEAYKFATQIMAALGRAGFKQNHLDPLPPGAGGPPWLPTVIKLGGDTGLAIVDPDPIHGAPPVEGVPIIGALLNAFAACGFEVKTGGATFFPGGRLKIIVGARP